MGEECKQKIYMLLIDDWFNLKNIHKFKKSEGTMEQEILNKDLVQNQLFLNLFWIVADSLKVIQMLALQHSEGSW